MTIPNPLQKRLFISRVDIGDAVIWELSHNADGSMLSEIYNHIN